MLNKLQMEILKIGDSVTIRDSSRRWAKTGTKGTVVRVTRTLIKVESNEGTHLFSKTDAVCKGNDNLYLAGKRIGE